MANPADVLNSTQVNALRSVVAGGSTTLIATGSGDAALPGRALWRFKADTASDFAWGTSPFYEWIATSVIAPARPPIVLHALYRIGNASTFRSAVDAVAAQIVVNSAMLTDYPFPQLSLIDGPEHGMEYPMVTFTDGEGLAHELWHQWFPMMVGTNETNYAFLDEGISAFLAGITRARMSGESWMCKQSGRVRSAIPLIYPDGDSLPHAVTAILGYGRGYDLLCALSGKVGIDVLLSAIKDYAAAWRFKHPTPWDFMAMTDKSTKSGLDAFWRRWVFSAP